MSHLLRTAALAASLFALESQAAPALKATCGDHWLYVDIMVNNGFANVAFGGDSGVSESWQAALATSWLQPDVEQHTVYLDPKSTLTVSFRNDTFAPWGEAVYANDQGQVDLRPCHKLLD